MLYAFAALLVIIIDQALKIWVSQNIVELSQTLLAPGSTRSVTLIPGVLSLVNVHNDGAAFSIFSGGGATTAFIVLTLVFVAAVIYALATNYISGRFGRWCMVLVAAGGLSNCIDRVIHGYVQDMFKIELFDFAVFNVADMFITVFCIAFLVHLLFFGEEGEKDSSADKR